MGNKTKDRTMRTNACAAMLMPLIISLAGVLVAVAQPDNTAKSKGQPVKTPPPVKPPLQSVDITRMPTGVDQMDLYLLIGQSNMKGRGFMPEEPARDPRIVMMHIRDDQWYVARHPLHLTGNAKTFAGADNAGVGPGLAFAEALAARAPATRMGLIPCAVGGSAISLWQKGARLYDEALRRAKLALQTTAPVQGRIRGALWLQGESDSPPERRAVYEEKLLKLVDDLRTDLGLPDLPFIACTVGEMKNAENNAAINKILLALPEKRPHTACVDARDLKGHIGDGVHFDTASQNEIGKRFAAKWVEIMNTPTKP
jgi:hypothetical protein